MLCPEWSILVGKGLRTQTRHSCAAGNGLPVFYIVGDIILTKVKILCPAQDKYVGAMPAWFYFNSYNFITAVMAFIILKYYTCNTFLC